MNIVLTQKDADFILKYIRMDARRIDERYKMLEENEKNLRESCEKLNKYEPKTAALVSDFAKNLGNNARNELTELKNDFAKCIELLTAGSEVQNEI